MVTKTNPADAFLPHPSASWYDPQVGTSGGGIEYVFRATAEERRSYARFILAGHGGERSWELRHLADWDRAALAPWASHLLAFDDAALEQLIEVDFVNFWRAAVGASAAAVDALAARIDRAPPTVAWNTVGLRELACARTQLLIGVDTDQSLARLGELGRAYPVIDEICQLHGVWVPPTGPAVRRYVVQPLELVRVAGPGNPRLRTFPKADSVLVDPLGRGCAQPLSVALELDLSLLAGDPFAHAPQKKAQALTSLCTSCDESTSEYRWRIVATGEQRGQIALDEERDPRCQGQREEDGASAQPFGLELAPSQRYASDRQGIPDVVGELGGRPAWVQAYSSWLGCCDKPMFFVAHADINAFGGVGVHVYAFQCECGVGAQTVQST